jgi:hypothetical protein
MFQQTIVKTLKLYEDEERDKGISQLLLKER